MQVQKSGNSVRLLSSDGETTATIVYPDVRACNAIIQVVDTVLSPAASAAAAAAPTAVQATPVLPAIALQGHSHPARSSCWRSVDSSLIRSAPAHYTRR